MNSEDASKTKEVLYSEWCNKCEHKDLDEDEDPCNECLSYPYNWDSHKPVKFKEIDV